MASNNPALQKAGMAVLAVAAGKKIWESLTTTKHDRVVKTAYDTLTAASAEDTTIYADHISKGESPHGVVDGIEGVPDLVVTSGSQNNLLVEVETAESIENNSVHAVEQLDNFQKKGYRRVIAVSSADANSEIVSEWLKDIEQQLEGKLSAARADNIHSLL